MRNESHADSPTLPMPVFILHWNRPDRCIRTVRSFRSQQIPVQITVLDNGSRPEAVARLRDELLPFKCRILELNRNMGWGPAFNIVLTDWLRNSTEPFCLVSAHDTLLDSDCLTRLISAVCSDPSIGMASPEYGIAHLPRYSPIRGPRLVPISPRDPTVTEYCDFCHGTLTLFRRECLKDIGTYDPRFFAYGDETEIGVRAGRSGWNVAIVWGARIVNPGTWTPKPLMTYLFARNSLIMASIYGGYGSALARAGLMVLNTLRSTLVESHNVGSDFFRIRLLAIRDFLSRRSGAPPFQLFQQARTDT
jgi:N-acetylglucosaminyl-diphospho-decaprenol L-rhamnosyltransferase